MNNMTHFLNMGGYGPYVFTTYGLTLFVFGINWFASIYERKQIKKLIQQHWAQSS